MATIGSALQTYKKQKMIPSIEEPLMLFSEDESAEKDDKNDIVFPQNIGKMRKGRGLLIRERVKGSKMVADWERSK
jgi:hypothetical protein